MTTVCNNWSEGIHLSVFINCVCFAIQNGFIFSFRFDFINLLANSMPMYLSFGYHERNAFLQHTNLLMFASMLNWNFSETKDKKMCPLWLTTGELNRTQSSYHSVHWTFILCTQSLFRSFKSGEERKTKYSGSFFFGICINFSKFILLFLTIFFVLVLFFSISFDSLLANWGVWSNWFNYLKFLHFCLSRAIH